MRVLIAVKGTEPERFFRHVMGLIHPHQEFLLAHVIDAGPRQGMEIGRHHGLPRHALSPERQEEMQQAEDERARAALQFARQALMAAGVPEDRVREITLRGRPNEELRDLARREDVELLVVGGRRENPGPHSIGKTARFLIDHAERAALMVRA